MTLRHGSNPATSIAFTFVIRAAQRSGHKGTLAALSLTPMHSLRHRLVRSRQYSPTRTAAQRPSIDPCDGPSLSLPQGRLSNGCGRWVTASAGAACAPPHRIGEWSVPGGPRHQTQFRSKAAAFDRSPRRPKKRNDFWDGRTFRQAPTSRTHTLVSMIRVLRGRQTLTTSSAARLLSTAGHMPRQARSLPLTSLCTS